MTNLEPFLTIAKMGNDALDQAEKNINEAHKILDAIIDDIRNYEPPVITEKVLTVKCECNK